jgi:hypothetical protein
MRFSRYGVLSESVNTCFIIIYGISSTLSHPHPWVSVRADRERGRARSATPRFGRYVIQLCGCWEEKGQLACDRVQSVFLQVGNPTTTNSALGKRIGKEKKHCNADMLV